MTPFYESRVNFLKFEHLSNQRTKITLWLVRDNALMRRYDWCEMHTRNDLISARNIPLYTLTYRVIIFFFIKKVTIKMNGLPQLMLLIFWVHGTFSCGTFCCVWKQAGFKVTLERTWFVRSLKRMGQSDIWFVGKSRKLKRHRLNTFHESFLSLS